MTAEEDCPKCKQRTEERGKDFARRVVVEQFLLDCYQGKRPLPDKEVCRMLAHRLGIPDEYRREGVSLEDILKEVEYK